MDEQPQITPIVPEAPKKSVLFPVLLAIFLTVAVSGGGMYYWLNQLMDQSIAGLQGQLTALSAEKLDAEKRALSSAEELKTAIETGKGKIEEARVVFDVPANYTGAEQKMLQDEVITFYTQYYGVEAGVGDPLRTMIVKKSTVDLGQGKASLVYHFTAVHRDRYAEFDYSPENTEFWTPKCIYRDCRDFPSKFKEMYPKIFEAAMALVPAQ
jgi:hypothetical protein